MIKVILSILVLAVWFPPTPASGAAEEGEALSLKVATFNIRYGKALDFGPRAWRNRRDRVVSTLTESDLDLFGVQEALANQMDDLRGALPGYETVGVGRGDGERAGEFSAIFFRRDRFEADEREQGTFWLSDRPEEPGSKTWGNAAVRICTWVRLKDKATGRGFYVFNSHWDHRHQGSREKAARLIGERINARRHGGEPVILMGDLNAGLENPALKYLLGEPVDKGVNQGKRLQPGFKSAYLLAHPDKPQWRTFNGWNPAKRRGGMIDHILVSDPWQVKSCQVVFADGTEAPPSDHFPVVAELVLR